MTCCLHRLVLPLLLALSTLSTLPACVEDAHACSNGATTFLGTHVREVKLMKTQLALGQYNDVIARGCDRFKPSSNHALVSPLWGVESASGEEHSILEPVGDEGTLR